MNNFIPLVLWQLKMLFVDSCLNSNIYFLKIANLSKLFILLSRFSHSVKVDGKYEFLKKYV